MFDEDTLGLAKRNEILGLLEVDNESSEWSLGDIYSDEDASYLLDDDEIDAWEAAFMRGYRNAYI